MKSLFVVAALLASASVAHATPIIPDYSFEDPSVGNSYNYNPVVAGVSFAGSSGVQGNGSAFGYANAPAGTQTAHLQNFSSITFELTGLTMGQRYKVSYFDALRPGYSGLAYRVSVPGATIRAAMTAPSVSFTKETTSTFIAMGTRLTFDSLGSGGGDYNVAIDNVTIAAVNAVPEPAALALLGLGAAMLGVARRHRG